MIGITLLGSTGSIGVNTLDVVERHRERFRIVALTANRDAEGLAAQCRRHRPEYAVMADPPAADELTRGLSDLSDPPEVLVGTDALASVATLPQVDCVVAAIVGAAGLLPTLAAARASSGIMWSWLHTCDRTPPLLRSWSWHTLDSAKPIHRLLL